MPKTTPEEFMSQFSDFVNTSSRNNAQVIEAFSMQHRTLQQSMLRMMLVLIEHMSSDDYRTDGRNTASKKVAKMIIEGFNEMTIKEIISQGYTREVAEEYVKSEYYKPSRHLPLI